MPYGAKDLPLINRILQFYPEVDALARTVKHISPKAKYPINSLNELTDALGADDEGSDAAPLQSLLGLPGAIPAYYFPIASEEDLIAKLLELRGQRPRAQEAAFGALEPSPVPLPRPMAPVRVPEPFPLPQTALTTELQPILPERPE
jgi:hypothetical protein